jgi:hypothetical protein
LPRAFRSDDDEFRSSTNTPSTPGAHRRETGTDVPLLIIGGDRFLAFEHGRTGASCSTCHIAVAERPPFDPARLTQLAAEYSARSAGELQPAGSIIRFPMAALRFRRARSVSYRIRPQPALSAGARS